jgi:hypothetical protein
MTTPSTIFFVFLVQLSLSIISTIGAQRVNDIVGHTTCAFQTPLTRILTGMVLLHAGVPLARQE